MSKKLSKSTEQPFAVANTVLLSCITLCLLVVVAFQISAMVFLSSRSLISTTVPLVRTVGVEGEVRQQLFTQATTCKNDNRTSKDRVAQFNTYLVVNATSDRAIIRMCNDIDQLYALDANGKWQPVFTVNADTKQDNKVRSACKIEDITVGEDDERSENQGMNAAKIEQCQQL